jgi:hypothetical protein
VYEQRFAFVGGLHRSGTTAVAQALGSHEQISGLERTGVPMDEGQHLQSVYPAAHKLGGLGLFGFSEQAHLTEASSLVSARTREALLDAWRPFWDMTRPVLLEKSPPNLVRTRFLQALFPEARFLAVVRHPVPVTLATRRLTKAPLEALLRHWAVCHEFLLEDAPHIENLLILRYEDIIAAPAEALGQAVAFLGLKGDVDVTGIQPGRSENYFSRWGTERCTIGAREADTAAQFGYNTRHPWHDLPVSPQVEALMKVSSSD